MLRPGALAAQHFSGNQLVRGATGKKLDAILRGAQGEPLYCLVADRRIAVRDQDVTGAAAAAATAVAWLDGAAGLASVGLFYGGTGEQLTLQGAGAGGGAPLQLPVYYLGEDTRQRGSAGLLRLAVDVSSAAPSGWAERHGMRLQDLRSLMAVLPPEELAIAGHAMALSQWHQAHLFCGRCGAPSTSVEAGARRQCSAKDEHRSYPRTDPVVIMLIEGPDGSSALLGRSKAMRPGMLTCLSGFVDQGESIEEAVQRETREEAGVALSAVHIVGSQPWPVGRGGSCELMIGCFGKAAATELTMDEEEMSEVRWVSREAILQACAEADSPSSPYLKPLGAGDSGSSSALGFFVPPRFAIAHHLMRRWAEHRRPWFEAQQPTQQQAAGGAAAATPAASL